MHDVHDSHRRFVPEPPDGLGGYGLVTFWEGEMIERLSGGEAITTSNCMEITEAIAGMRALRGSSLITLYSDSQYLIKTLTQFCKRMKNVEQWTQLD